MTTADPVYFASWLASSDQFDWPLTIALVLGMGIGFFVVWATTRQTRRVAHEQAEELITVARREAAVAAEEETAAVVTSARTAAEVAKVR